MNLLTVEGIKLQSRVFGCEEDDVIELYGESAEQTVLNIIERTYDELVAWCEEQGKSINPVRHAALMLAAHSYKERELASAGNLYAVPYAFDMLLKPYMRLSSTD